MSDPGRGGAAGGGGSGGGAGGPSAFVPQGDRPDVQLDPNRPIGELRVRDLSQLLGQITIKKFDWKEPFKEFKDHKHEKWEFKHEWKEWKHEKWEHDPVVKPGPDNFPDPTQRDPILNEIVQVVGGLRQQIGQLENQVKELQGKIR